MDALAIVERLATIETRLEGMDGRLESIDKHQVLMELDMRQVRESFSKYRGFTAGFAAAFSFLWSVLTGLAVYILTGHKA